MLSAHALEYVALAVALGGLFSVVAEIVVKDPNLFGGWFGGKTVAARNAIQAMKADDLRGRRAA